MTRAINAPASHRPHHHVTAEEGEKRRDSDEKMDINNSKDNMEYGNEISVVPNEGVTDDAELDRAGLKGAFRFAAWSSLALVSSFCTLERIRTEQKLAFLSILLMKRRSCPPRVTLGYQTVGDNDHPNPPSAILRGDDIWSTRTVGLGGHRYHLDILLCVYGSHISSMGEPGGAGDGFQRYHQGELRIVPVSSILSVLWHGRC